MQNIKPIKKTRKDLFRHAKKRAKERYDLSLTNEDLNALVKLIQNNKGIFVKRMSLNRTMFLVEYKNQNLKVVYDKARHAVVTLLPKLLKGKEIKIVKILLDK